MNTIEAEAPPSRPPSAHTACDDAQVEMVIPIETLGDRFEKENPGMEEFDHVAWREYFEKWEKFHTYCLTCMAKKKEEQKGDAGILDISASSSEEEEDDGARF